MDIWSTLERARRLWPQAIGVVDGARRLTWAEVALRTERLASFLVAQGVAPGDRVAILAHNRLEFLETTYAAAGAGAILCPLNVRSSAADLAAVLADAGARWLVADGDLADLAGAVLELETPVEGVICIGGVPADAADRTLDYDVAVRGDARPFVPARRSGSDVAHLVYTSGTTGEPKGVMLTHENVCVHALATVAELRLSDGDVWGHVAPMFHLADAWATVAITWVGGRHAMLHRFDATDALALLEREGVSVTNLIPTMLNRMVRHPGARDRDLSRMRFVLSGGAPIAPALVAEVIALFGCEYVQTYGMTETSPYLTLSLLKSHMRDLPAVEQLAYRSKTGRPMLGVELEVVGEDGRAVPADDVTVGEIRVRGPTVTPGYWNRPEATAEAFEGGWLETGDLAVVDPEGYVTIVDRKKDVIITGGEKVYSTEVENVLYAHPEVLEAAVYGERDPDWGERVAAAIVHRGSGAPDAEAIQRHCREHLAGFKVPRTIVFLADLPRTGSGKIAKRELRDARGPSL